MTSGRLFHVSLPSYQCTGRANYEHRKFCRERNIRVSVSGYRDGDMPLVRVFAFIDPRHAREFREEFAGSVFFQTSALRPAGWLEWDGAAKFEDAWICIPLN